MIHTYIIGWIYIFGSLAQIFPTFMIFSFACHILATTHRNISHHFRPVVAAATAAALTARYVRKSS